MSGIANINETFSHSSKDLFLPSDSFIFGFRYFIFNRVCYRITLASGLSIQELGHFKEMFLIASTKKFGRSTHRPDQTMA